LGALHKPDGPDRFRAVGAVARRQPVWLGKQAAALVVAEGLDVHPGLGCDL
jgi:hypothetical protein